MPCYEVNLISVKFSGRSEEILQAIGAMRTRMGLWSLNGVDIDIKEGTAIGEQEDINVVKKAYSEESVRQMAKKKGWTMGKKGINKWILNKY